VKKLSCPEHTVTLLLLLRCDFAEHRRSLLNMPFLDAEG
jgi:hypothetical protein